MSRIKKVKNKHLSYEHRLSIQSGIHEQLTLREIAEEIGCDPTTVSKEVKKHRFKKVVNHNMKHNVCARKKVCRRRNVCNKKHGYQCKIACKSCRSCNERCSDFIKRECKLLSRYPYVCTMCEDKTVCEDVHYYYSAKGAQKEYEDTLINSREGICISKDELQELDELISPKVEAGHSLAMIYMNHKGEIMVSMRTLYKYIEKGVMASRNIDLRRRVRYRERKKRKRYLPTESKVGHLYKDFKEEIAQNPKMKIWEMDTVEGEKGGSVLMTLLLRGYNFMFVYHMKNKSAEGVIEVFDELERLLGSERFKEIFEVILTDNGLEFSNIKRIEANAKEEKRTKLYFCEPRQSQQKGALEKNHEYIRYILPKGKSFDFLDEEKVELMMNTINSVKRVKLKEKSPNELIKEVIDTEERIRLGIREIAQEEIVLRERLVR
jgi:Transposase and inactivated derivatives, IS30 family